MNIARSYMNPNSDTFAAKLSKPGDEISRCKSSKASIRDSWSKPVDRSPSGAMIVDFHKIFRRESAVSLLAGIAGVRIDRREELAMQL